MGGLKTILCTSIYSCIIDYVQLNNKENISKSQPLIPDFAIFNVRRLPQASAMVIKSLAMSKKA